MTFSVKPFSFVDIGNSCDIVVVLEILRYF